MLGKSISMGHTGLPPSPPTPALSQFMPYILPASCAYLFQFALVTSTPWLLLFYTLPFHFTSLVFYFCHPPIIPGSMSLHSCPLLCGCLSFPFLPISRFHRNGSTYVGHIVKTPNPPLPFLLAPLSWSPCSPPPRPPPAPRSYSFPAFFSLSID